MVSLQIVMQCLRKENKYEFGSLPTKGKLGLIVGGVLEIEGLVELGFFVLIFFLKLNGIYGDHTNSILFPNFGSLLAKRKLGLIVGGVSKIEGLVELGLFFIFYLKLKGIYGDHTNSILFPNDYNCNYCLAFVDPNSSFSKLVISLVVKNNLIHKISICLILNLFHQFPM
jgi:hypothetical protein